MNTHVIGCTPALPGSIKIILFYVCLLALSAFSAGCQDKNPAVALRDPFVIDSLAGLASPESFLYDAERDQYLVSSINGSIPAQDDNGFISRFNPVDGSVTTLKWIDGASPNVTLHSPKGMAIQGDRLFVADLSVVRVFNINTGAFVANIPIQGATFLNDLTVGSDGFIYGTETALTPVNGTLTATGNEFIYKINPDGYAVTIVVKTPDLDQPNGIITVGPDFMVASRGPSKKLYRVSAAGVISNVRQLPGAILDGIVRLPDGNLAVSSWETSTVYLVPADNSDVRPLISGLLRPAADMGYDTKRNKLLLPLLQANQGIIRSVDR